MVLRQLVLVLGLGLGHSHRSGAETGARTLFNGRDLDGWDTWLAATPPAVQSAPANPTSNPSQPGTGPHPAEGSLNRDQLGVFSVVTVDGRPALRISGQVNGGLISRDSLTNVHLRVEYRWGSLKWPPRHETHHHRDSGIMYWSVGPYGAESGAWMRSVQCNLMERGTGQFWSVGGTLVDIEGRRVVLEKEPSIPYRGEGPGESCLVWEPGAPMLTTSEGITPPINPEKVGDWNVAEVYAWGNVALHLLNGQVVLALANPRYRTPEGIEVPFRSGRIQLQSECAEIYFRSVEARVIDGIPAALLAQVPPSAPASADFHPLLEGALGPTWRQAGTGTFHRQNGMAIDAGGEGVWWLSGKQVRDFVLRGELFLPEDGTSMRLGVRLPEPGNDPAEALREGVWWEIGPLPRVDGEVQAREGQGRRVHRLSTVPAPGVWHRFEVAGTGPNHSLRLDGRVVATWTEAEPGRASGYLGLRNGPGSGGVKLRNLRLRELP